MVGEGWDWSTGVGGLGGGVTTRWWCRVWGMGPHAQIQEILVWRTLLWLVELPFFADPS